MNEATRTGGRDVDRPSVSLGPVLVPVFMRHVPGTMVLVDYM
jgi:hypothetical protein